MINVVNAVGTSDLKCPSECKSWLDFWEKKTKRSASYCRRCSSNFKDLCGGHVQLVEKRVDGHWYRLSNLYITPICAKCNHPDNNIIFQVNADDLIKA